MAADDKWRDGRVWDGNYQPSRTELDEPVSPPLDVLTRTADGKIEHLLSYQPPADATRPDTDVA